MLSKNLKNYGSQMNILNNKFKKLKMIIYKLKKKKKNGNNLY